MIAKAPDYDDLTPAFASVVRASADTVENRIESWGAVRSIEFTSITPQDADVYEVAFEHQKTRWVITLTPDGKIGGLGFGPAN